MTARAPTFSREAYAVRIIERDAVIWHGFKKGANERQISAYLGQDTYVQGPRARSLREAVRKTARIEAIPIRHVHWLHTSS